MDWWCAKVKINFDNYVKKCRNLPENDLFKVHNWLVINNSESNFRLISCDWFVIMNQINTQFFEYHFQTCSKLYKKGRECRLCQNSEMRKKLKKLIKINQTLVENFGAELVIKSLPSRLPKPLSLVQYCPLISICSKKIEN